jgi:Tfp pilus assembly protein PilX
VTPPAARLGDERGVALILGLVVLMTLSALALAFLAVSALEPRISRNLHDASRARWLAEAGIELGYGVLAATAADEGAWSVFLTAGTADAPWVDLPAALPGLTPAEGTCTVSIRKDPRTADGVIVRSVGTVNTTTRTIEVAVRRLPRSESDPSGRVRPIVVDWREF